MIYVRNDGSKVAVHEKPVHGQLRFVAAKRTALDGKEWWCIFDNEKNEYVCGSKYKKKLECEAEITHKLEKGELPFVPYDDGTFKQGNHKFAAESSISERMTTTTPKEIQKIIKRDERRIKRLREKIVDCKFDIECTRNAIRLWKKELRKAVVK